MPDGSKKVEDLDILREHPWAVKDASPALYCYDQEPLSYDMYSEVKYKGFYIPEIEQFLKEKSIAIPACNLRVFHNTNIYDKALLLHSELRSQEVEKYRRDQFIPVYYWSHALIARDWFRAAQHLEQAKNRYDRKPFLVYNRAWSNTREYRLKFLDLLIDANLTSRCRSWFNPVEPQDEIHYTNYSFLNSQFKPVNNLENVFPTSQASSHSSADFELEDYNHTDFEVVLETLFDDARIQLTEKILRPIACGHPFLILGPKGSLQYLRQYGFQTFGSIIDERYDTIDDPLERMNAVVNTMKTISAWSDEQRLDRIEVVKGILEHNKQLFFSNEFHNAIETELKMNLAKGFAELKETNTSETYFSTRKALKDIVLKYDLACKSRRELAANVWQARQYYDRFKNGL